MLRFMSIICFAAAFFLVDLPLAIAQDEIENAWTPEEIHVISNIGKNERLCKELEIVPSQLEKLRKIRSDNLQLSQLQFDFLFEKKLSKDEYEVKQRELTEKIEKQINELFLPHQLKRLRQVYRQHKHRAEDFDFGLGKKSLSKELEIEQQQTDKIKHQAQQHKSEVVERLKKLDEDLAKLRVEMKAEFFDILTEEQKKKYEQMFGTIRYPKMSDRIK